MCCKCVHFMLFVQSESLVVSETAAAALASCPVVVSSSDEADHDESSHSSAVAAAVLPSGMKSGVLPADIDDDIGLDDTEDDDCSLDVSGVSTDELLQIHAKIAEQRNSYRRKCVQVNNVELLLLLLLLLEPFYGSLHFVWDNSSEPVPVPEETYRGHQSSLSASSICYDPWHPPCSIYVHHRFFHNLCPVIWSTS